MAVYASGDGTKLSSGAGRIDIYREALKITKPFTPEELEELANHQKRAYEFLNR